MRHSDIHTRHADIQMRHSLESTRHSLESTRCSLESKSGCSRSHDPAWECIPLTATKMDSATTHTENIQVTARESKRELTSENSLCITTQERGNEAKFELQRSKIEAQKRPCRPLTKSAERELAINAGAFAFINMSPL